MDWVMVDVRWHHVNVNATCLPQLFTHLIWLGKVEVYGQNRWFLYIVMFWSCISLALYNDKNNIDKISVPKSMYEGPLSQAIDQKESTVRDLKRRPCDWTAHKFFISQTDPLKDITHLCSVPNAPQKAGSKTHFKSVTSFLCNQEPINTVDCLSNVYYI